MRQAPKSKAGEPAQHGEPISCIPALVVDYRLYDRTPLPRAWQSQSLATRVAQMQGMALKHLINGHTERVQQCQRVCVGAKQQVLAVVIGLAILLARARSPARVVRCLVEDHLPAVKTRVDGGTQARPTGPDDVNFGRDGVGQMGVSCGERSRVMGRKRGRLEGVDATVTTDPGLERAKPTKTF